MRMKMDPVLGEMRQADDATPMTSEVRQQTVLAAGQLVYDTDDGALYVGDGETPGGIVVSGGGGGGGDISYATVKDIMTGSGASKALNVKTLRGAMTSGQAVDVTSQPDGVTADYRSTFSVTGSLGFASFPKFASGLSYLMIADLTATTTGTVTPSGTWIDGTSTAKTLTAGTSTRVAMIFTTASTCKLMFSGTGSVSVSNLREYEITACTTEAIAYIAGLSDPDAFASYYLIKSDMVQPWTYIIDMGSSPAVTIASGLAYKLNATTGNHVITTDVCPAGYYGEDAHLELFVGPTGSVQFAPPLDLLNPLTPNAGHNITIKFRDGKSLAYVDDTDIGYVVTVTSGSSVGSLPYGLADSASHVVFAAGTDGVIIDLGGTTVTQEKRVIGNGYTSTTIAGNVTASANLFMNNLTLDGGTVTVGSGATLTLEYGLFAPQTIGGSGAVVFGENAMLDLASNTSAASVAPAGGVIVSGGLSIEYASGGSTVSASITGGTFATISSGGLFLGSTNALTQTNGGFSASGLSFTRSSSGIGMFVFSGGTATFIGCSGGDMKNGRYLEIGSAASVLVSDCRTDGGAQYSFIASGGTLTLAGSNFIGRGVGKIGAVSGGSLVILDGATINESGGFLAIEPGLGITFGANVTIINNAGTSSLLNGGSSGTCSKINTNGSIA